MKKNFFKIFTALAFVWMACCCFWCYQPDDLTISEENCLNHFQYKVYIMPGIDVFGEEILHLEKSAYSFVGEVNARANPFRTILDTSLFVDSIVPPQNNSGKMDKNWGPYKEVDIFDTLTFRLFFFCNGQWVSSRDYKFLNREDVFTHIDFKEQEEGELMFDVSADSVCQGLSSYRISQYTDTECIDELNGK